jgi:hypothetical protein
MPVITGTGGTLGLWETATGAVRQARESQPGKMTPPVAVEAATALGVGLMVPMTPVGVGFEVPQAPSNAIAALATTASQTFRTIRTHPPGLATLC